VGHPAADCISSTVFVARLSGLQGDHAGRRRVPGVGATAILLMPLADTLTRALVLVEWCRIKAGAEVLRLQESGEDWLS
jgi:hypothetical protein